MAVSVRHSTVATLPDDSSEPAGDQASNWQSYSRKRTKSEREEQEELAQAIREQRIALGILPREAEVIEEIAEEVVSAPVLERVDARELERKLEDRNIVYAATFAAYFEFYREKLIDEELKAYFKKRRKLRVVLSLLH